MQAGRGEDVAVGARDEELHHAVHEAAQPVAAGAFASKSPTARRSALEQAREPSGKCLDGWLQRCVVERVRDRRNDLLLERLAHLVERVLLALQQIHETFSKRTANVVGHLGGLRIPLALFLVGGLDAFTVAGNLQQLFLGFDARTECLQVARNDLLGVVQVLVLTLQLSDVQFLQRRLGFSVRSVLRVQCGRLVENAGGGLAHAFEQGGLSRFFRVDGCEF
ncbi:hypothetical protein D3C71_1315870 [compost metagenome]